MGQIVYDEVCAAHGGVLKSAELTLPSGSLNQVADALDDMEAKTKKDEASLIYLLAKPLPQVVVRTRIHDPRRPMQRQ
jgi:hypothetical protein